MSLEPDALAIVTTSRFEHDAKRARKRGWDMARLVAVVDTLRQRRPLAARHRDHALSGQWQDWRDCHIEPDWLLICRVDEAGGALILGRTGTHADLFE